MLQFPLRLLAWHQQIASIMMVARRLEIQGIMLYQNIQNSTNTAGMHRSTCEYVLAYCTKVSLRSPPLSSTTKPTCLILGYIPYYIDCNSSRSVFPCCIRFHFTVRFYGSTRYCTCHSKCHCCAKPWYLTMFHHHSKSSKDSCHEHEWDEWSLARMV